MKKTPKFRGTLSLRFKTDLKKIDKLMKRTRRKEERSEEKK
jgi:hypothetical protein